VISSEQLAIMEICPRRRLWQEQYASLRVSLVGALYRGLAAGLTAENDPEKEAERAVLALAARPGLDFEGPTVYAVAMHTSKLAGILAVALRNSGPAWSLFPGSDAWASACYDAGDGEPRRVVLVDRWNDERKASEATSWRTIGELVSLERPIFLTSVEIGTSRAGHRISPWTRAYRHPKNRTCRFRKLHGGEKFGSDWLPVWREDCELKTKEWLDLMAKDGCMDAVQTSRIGLPQRPERYLEQIRRLWDDMSRPGTPPMRLAGCYDKLSGACQFLEVCHGAKEPDPARYNFRLRGSALA
jgi:hypothetical protein